MTPRLEFELEPRAPFRLDLTAWALRRQAHNAIDRWDGLTYQRAMSLDGDPVALSVTQVARRSPQLSVLLAGRPIDQRAEAHARSALDTAAGADRRPLAVRRHGRVGPVARPARGANAGAQAPALSDRLRGTGQRRRLPAAVARGRASICSTASPLTAEERWPTLRTARARSPTLRTSQSLAPDDLKRHGFSTTKARTIIETARAIVTGDLDLEALHSSRIGAAIERLTSLRGIGRWTAEYVLLRGLGRLHVFPGDDVGAHNKLRRLFGIDTPLDYEAVQQLVARWHPTPASSTSTCSWTRFPRRPRGLRRVVMG